MPRQPPVTMRLEAYRQMLDYIAAARRAEDAIRASFEASKAQKSLGNVNSGSSDGNCCVEQRASKRQRFSSDQEKSACETTALDQSLSSSAFYTFAELEAMHANNSFMIPSATQLQQIRDIAIQQMQTCALERTPCCVCELDHDPDKISTRKLSESLLKKMKLCLTRPQNANIPEFLISQYDASPIDERLHGLLLFPSGALLRFYKREQHLDIPALYLSTAIRKVGEDVNLQVCESCHRELMRDGSALPPALAIANGNYIGYLPDNLHLTRTDEQIVALVSPCMSISTVTGGSCRTLKSHHYIVENTEGPILTMFPRDVSEHVRVAMVGSMTSEQVAACRRRYDVNVAQCRRALSFFIENNIEYRQYLDDHPDSSSSAMKSISETTSILIDRTTQETADDGFDNVAYSVRDDSTYSRFGSADPPQGDKTLEYICEDASSLLLRQKGRKCPLATDILVRKSTRYVTKQGWAACVRMFPTLFPGGCGGPTEPRKRPLSLLRWLRRCLRIHGHRFETHYAFMLLAFDYLASENARKTMFFKMHVSSSALKAASISRSTLKAAIDYFDYLNEIKARALKPSRPPLDVQQVIELRRGLRVPEAAYYGSNMSRMRARHDLFGMLKRFGPMQLFFTVSPDSAGTYSISIKSGVVPAAVVTSANYQLLPKRAERRSIAANHPMECARYFVRVMDTVIETFLGWDQKARQSKRGGGIFGVVRAFAAAAETQVAGDLHAHFVVWLHGFPRTSTAIKRCVERDDEFKRRLLALTDVILTTRPPCLEDEDSCCSLCDGHPRLTPVLPGVDAFRKPVRGAEPPTTARCDVCGSTFGANDIINEAITALADREQVEISDYTADYERCRPPRGTESSLALSLVVRDVQVHFWYHSRSCFKATIQTPKGSVCRFFKPEAVNTKGTTIGEDGKLRLHRPVGCEYVNGYNTTLMTVLKCNHDVQFVLCEDTKNTAAYVCKYCIKSQNPIENGDALSIAAFAKAAKRTDSLAPTSSALDRGKKILSSMLYTVTNGQEVAAPMAALYILRESPFWFSHELVRVDINRFLKAPSDTVEVSVPADIDASGSKKKKFVAPLNHLQKYWCREKKLDRVAFIEYCEGIQTTNSKSPISVPAGVLVICGREIPAISPLSAPCDRDFYYKAVLTLFKPHRQTTLMEPGKSAFETYHDFICSGDSNHVSNLEEFEAILKDYHRSSKNGEPAKSAESAESRLLKDRAPATTAWNGIDQSESKSVQHENDLAVSDPCDMGFEEVGQSPSYSTEVLLAAAQYLIDAIPCLRDSVDGTAETYPSVSMEVFPDNIDTDHYASIVAKTASATSEKYAFGTHVFIGCFPDAETRLDRFKECFSPVPWHQHDHSLWTVQALPDFPTIAMVSEAYCLNFWQHVIFETAARHLLFAYSKDIDAALNGSLFPAGCINAPYQIKSQLIGYLGGEAGTGKSTVVCALLKFADKWGREGSVETLAFTGVAAINIQGRTLHSARNLKLATSQRDNDPSADMKAKFSRVVMIIIDEISMTDQALLGRTDAVSREMSNRKLKFMGGRHTLFLGDWLQLPTVAGSPCFDKPGIKAAASRHAGYAVYDAVNFVVFLTENMRARLDPVYTGILSELRCGRVSDVHLATLNTRVQSHLSIGFESVSPPGFYRPIVVSTNNLRCAINRAMTFQIARRLKLPVYECMAIPSVRSREILTKIVNINDDLSDRVPIKLLFYVGMPVMVTRKHPDLLQADVIANGVLGKIVGFYPPDDALCFKTIEIDGTTVKQLHQQPKLMFVKIRGVSKVLVEGFPGGVIGIPPLHAQIRLTKIPNLQQASITVDQFAIVPAFACTTEKLQGQTCHDGIVVTPLDRRKAVPRQSLYVALSRCINLEKLTLTNKLTREYLQRFQPSQEVESEMKRLISKIVMPPYISPENIAAFDRWKGKQQKLPAVLC